MQDTIHLCTLKKLYSKYQRVFVVVVDIDGEGDGGGNGGVGGGKLLTLLRIPNFPIFLCTSVKPICQIYAKWIKFLSCEFIVYFTHWIFLKNKKDKCALFSQSFSS